jgi:hypothetical protein
VGFFYCQPCIFCNTSVPMKKLISFPMLPLQAGDEESEADIVEKMKKKNAKRLKRLKEIEEDKLLHY